LSHQNNNENPAVRFDWQREQRNGIPEVVYGQGKSLEQLVDLINTALTAKFPLFVTRVDEQKAQALNDTFSHQIRYHALSRTLKIADAYCKQEYLKTPDKSVVCAGVVAAGTSDLPLVAEIEESLHFLGVACDRHVDVGVAGLWRLLTPC